MSCLTRFWHCVFWTWLGVSTLTLAEESPVSAAGHWEGQIKVPGASLGIRLDIEHKDGTWEGTIDIPAQGLRGFKLSGFAAEAFDVRFDMEGIPGDPSFKGKLKEAGRGMAGTFTQGGQSFPFELARAPLPQPKAGETPRKGQPGTGLAGFWQGSLKVLGVSDLRIAVEISKGPEGEYKGVAVSLDQGNARMPLSGVSEKKGQVHMEVASVGGLFEGELSPDGSEIVGHWSQNGARLPLVYKRMTAPAKSALRSRPQDPKKPFPYTVENVVVPTRDAGVKLAGTLTLPRGVGTCPAVVLITGSGPQDRDEAIMGHRPFLVLADHLTRHGIAVLRCDDRGVGKSSGRFAEATEKEFVEDTLAAVDWLKSRKEIDPKRIGLVGHSEGGIIGPRAVVARPGDIAFLVMLAGVGVPMEELLVKQSEDSARAAGQSPEVVATLTAIESQALQALKTAKTDAEGEAILRSVYEREVGKLSSEAKKSMGLSVQALTAQVKTESTRWFRELVAYDPEPVLRQVHCPVLALNGEKDVQVSAKENLAGIRAALTQGGNLDIKTVAFPNLNHLFQTCTTGGVAEYAEIEETFSPLVLKVISDWIRLKSGLAATDLPPKE